jgi:hypothetical protein
MSNKEHFFEIVPVSNEDWEGLSPSEAYACGLEIGCFIQAVTLSKSVDETLKIQIPSERSGRVKTVLERLGEEGKFYWINDDVMLVIVER